MPSHGSFDSGEHDDVEERPILVCGSVLQEVMSGFNGNTQLEDNSLHMEADVLGGEAVLLSSSGGIPVKVCNVSDDEEFLEGDFEHTINPAVRAAFSVNKYEREELVKARAKIMELQGLLLKKGVSVVEADMEILKKTSDFNKGSGLPDLVNSHGCRDEYGLPDMNVLFGKVRVELPSSMPRGATLPKSCLKPVRGALLSKGSVSGSTNDKGIDLGNSNSTAPEVVAKVSAKSWSQVLKSDPPPQKEVVFDYVPLPPGTKVVSLPQDILNKGVEKFKNCVVGTFPKGLLGLKVVNEIALKIWGTRGLQKVWEKNEFTFFFKFNSMAEKNAALSRGTWYFERRPMIVRDWCCDVVNKPLTKFPLWFKLTNVPDCYWTKEGLSSLASVIGPPLCADNITSQLELCPFAKMCVQYNAGNDLPNIITAIDNVGVAVEVKVSYFNKPLFCSVCQSLGHSIASCPEASRKWVRKFGPINASTNQKEGREVPPTKQAPEIVTNIAPMPSPISGIFGGNHPAAESMTANTTEAPWITVQGKQKTVKDPAGPIQTPVLSSTGLSPDNKSPAPSNMFHNVRVDEIDKKRGLQLGDGNLSKSQMKKLKKAAGKSPPPLSK